MKKNEVGTKVVGTVNKNCMLWSLEPLDFFDELSIVAQVCEYLEQEYGEIEVF